MLCVVVHRLATKKGLTVKGLGFSLPHGGTSGWGSCAVVSDLSVNSGGARPAENKVGRP